MTSSNSLIYLGELNDTPLGDFRLAASNLGLLAVEWADSKSDLDAYLARLNQPLQLNTRKLAPYAKELKEYLAGKRREFTFDIDWSFIRPFQRLTLQAVYSIPYGKTRTYGEIAAQVKHPHAYRAVGRANATNPMPLVIPCHRVIGADGKLHGYGGKGGLKTKEWLLKMERNK